MSTQFQPENIAEAQCQDGDLGQTPMPAILAAMLNGRMSGRLSVQMPEGPQSIFFVNGGIVGALPAKASAPLGRMLLELGHVRSPQYVLAERTIHELKRDEEQVYRELCDIDEDEWKRVVSLQTHHYVREAVALKEGSFSFCRGLSFVSGFSKAPIKTAVAIFLAQREHIEARALELWVDGLVGSQVRAHGSTGPFPAEVKAYELDIAEARFMARLSHKFHDVGALIEHGALTKAQVGLFLFHLERMDFLEVREPNLTPKSEEIPRVKATSEGISAFATQATNPHLSQPPPQAKVEPKVDPKVKRRKGRRVVAEPSEGVSATAPLRIEKEPLTELSSIVIEGLDD